MTQGAQYRNDMAFKREQAGADNKRADNYLRLAQDREGRLAKSETAQEGRETTKFGWEEQDRQVKQALQQMDLIVRVSGSVKDQSSHEQAVAQLQQMEVDTSKIPQAFDQNFWKRQQDLAISTADKIKRQQAVEDQKTGHQNALALQGAQDSAAMARTRETITGQKDIAQIKANDKTLTTSNLLRIESEARRLAQDPVSGEVDEARYEAEKERLMAAVGQPSSSKGSGKGGGWKDSLSEETRRAYEKGTLAGVKPAQPPQPGKPAQQPPAMPQAVEAQPQNALRAKPGNPMEFQQGSYTAPNGKVVNWEDIKDTAQKMWSATGIDQAANAIWKGLGFVGDASIDFVKWLAAQQAEARKGLPAYKGQ